MTTLNNMIIKFPGIFENKEPRIKDGYISVLDIIQIAGGITKNSVHNTWKRIKDGYGDILTDCKDLKFSGAGQKETPCINITGFVKLLMIIPGKLADKFRSDIAPIIIRHLGGDTSLINEIKYTNTLHIQNGESNIFRKVIKKKLSYDSDYYLYVRVYSPFFEAEQKNTRIDEKVRKITWDILKFGVAKYLDNRENSYSSDSAYFQFTIKVPSKECALFIEKICRQEFKEITIDNTYEYLDSKKLAKHFNIIKNTDKELERRDYYLTAKELYTKILIDFHMYYPEEKDNFGNMYHPQAQETEDFTTIITTSITVLNKEKLPNYILKECQIINEEKIEKEIIEENNKTIEEIDMDQEKLLEELRLEKVKTRNLLNLIEKESPEIFLKFIEINDKSQEHHRVWGKNKIFQYTLDGKFIADFNSISEVSKYSTCSPKAVRNHIKNKKSFKGFLWRSSVDVVDRSDLLIPKIEQCDISSLHIIKTFDNFQEVSKVFNCEDVCKSIESGLIYNNFRWKFNDTSIVMKKENGRTGCNKRLAKLNDDNQQLEIFASLKSASENMKISNSYLSDCIRKKKKCQGYFWEYII